MKKFIITIILLIATNSFAENVIPVPVQFLTGREEEFMTAIGYYDSPRYETIYDDTDTLYPEPLVGEYVYTKEGWLIKVVNSLLQQAIKQRTDNVPNVVLEGIQSIVQGEDKFYLMEDYKGVGDMELMIIIPKADIQPIVDGYKRKWNYSGKILEGNTNKEILENRIIKSLSWKKNWQVPTGENISDLKVTITIPEAEIKQTADAIRLQFFTHTGIEVTESDRDVIRNQIPASLKWVVDNYGVE